MGASALEVLRYSTTIAVVGASRHPYKPAHSVPEQMQRHGYRVIPVNPEAEEIFGEPVYRSLAEIPTRVDVVEVFRPAADAASVAAQAVAIGARALWLQSGIVSDEARRIAEAAGLDYVEDSCMAVVRAINRVEKTP